MLTNVQGLINELTTYQINEGYKLGGKGPAMKKLAGTIKEIFLATVGRGRFAINKDIWDMFCEAVGIEAPAPTPTPAPATLAPQTNKVAGEILEHVKGHLVAINLLDKAMEAQLNTMDRQAEKLDSHQAILQSLVGMVSDLQKQVAELKKPASPRRGARAKVEDSIELASV
jgi:hypothetical protein